MQIYLRMYSRSHAHFRRSATHMRKIYIRMYLNIYVNLLMYVCKNATSKVTLCSHEFYRQVYFSFNTSHFLILIKNEKNEETSSKCSWGNTNKRHMEKGDIISLVGKNNVQEIFTEDQ